MKLLILTQFGETGGSSRIQVLQFVPGIRAAGVDVMVRPIYPDAFWSTQMGLVRRGWLHEKLNLVLFLGLGLLKKLFHTLTAWRHDIVLIQKETFPALLFRLLTRINRRVIYEMDDTIFEINPGFSKDPIKLVLQRMQARQCKFMMKRACFVVAENEYIADEVRRHNDQVALVTSPIDTGAFVPRSRAKPAGEPLTLGWIGSPSTTYMLAAITPVFAALRHRTGGWRLKVVGADPEFDIEGIDLQHKPWRLEEQLADLQSFDIGLMPLDDSPFNRGRLGYKMVQYMAVGIPVVASNLGLNRSVIKDGENGFLVGDEQGWVERLEQLIDDPAARARMGQVGRALAVERFSVQRNLQVWLDVFGRVTQQ